MDVVSVPFTTFAESVPRALDSAGARELLAGQERILIKPNLINSSPPPITTPAACVEAVIKYCRQRTDAELVVADGCGEPSCETDELFELHGYRQLEREYGVQLLDLNNAPTGERSIPACDVFPSMILPSILFSHFLLSVPVLKAHSLADITGGLKGMIGAAPPKHYEGRFGSWKKAVFHGRMQQSIIDLCAYRRPDFTLMDASVGLATFHLGGPECDPPAARILAGRDPWAVDRKAADLLGLNWTAIGHLSDKARDFCLTQHPGRP